MVKSVKISGIKQEEKMNKTDGGKVPSRCKKKMDLLHLLGQTLYKEMDDGI